MTYRIITSFFLLALSINYALSEVVLTPTGKIDGLTRTLRFGPKVDEFLGIPYAEPPIGTNRFASPKPLKPWNGTYYAQKKSSSCFQTVSSTDKMHNWWMAKSPESEDCLYLNIWRPTVRPQKNLPVMVWVHGGVLVAGSASMPLYDGAILSSTQNVIIVSFNYRLSFLGQLFLDIPGAPGNQVLQDQIIAFQWVQENIEAFGGDSKKVTLFGHSSGSQLIGLHLTNKLTAGLYRNVIMQSGTPNSPSISSRKEDALKQSLDLAKTVGCPFSSEHDKIEILGCLRGKNLTELIRPYQQFPNYFMLPFSLVRNGLEVPLNAGNSDRDVLPVVKVPILLGTVTDESGESIKFSFPGKDYNDNTVVNETEWNQLITKILGLKDQRLVAQSTFLYKNFNSSYNLRKEVVEFLSDSSFVCNSVGYANMYSSEGGITYMYSYSHPLASKVWDLPSWAGTVHGAEIPFVFGIPLCPENHFSEEETKLSFDLMKCWVRFAETNDPNDEPCTKVFWPLYDVTKRNYLQIGLNSAEVGNGLRDHQCSLWKNIVPGLISLQRDLDEIKSTPTKK